jgi:hypothetical protein
MPSLDVKIEGYKELEALFEEMMEDFGDKDQKSILRKRQYTHFRI